MNKKKKKQLNRDRQISRDKRNELRREIKENVSLHRNDEVFQVLFVLKETENMERILFNITSLDNKGNLINLPVITQTMVDEYKNKTYKELILQHFGIESDNIELVEGTKLLVVKDFKVVNNIKNLVDIIVRPYNEYIWYDNNCITTLYGERIFNDKKLKDFFILNSNLENIYVYQDTITCVLIYRIKENKINEADFVNRYIGINIFGVECGNRKKRTDTAGWSTLHKIMAKDDESLNQILANEKEEIKTLLNNDETSKPKKLVCK